MATEKAIAYTRFPGGTFRKTVAAVRSPTHGGHSEAAFHERAPVMDERLMAYLRALAGEAPDSEYLEVRYRVARDTLAADFLPAQDTRAVADSISCRALRTDVYVGCAPRCRRSGTKRDVDRVWVLWAECDGADAARAALAYEPPPSIVIASGSGPNIHAYWPLRFPLSAPAAEHANLRIAQALGADRACGHVIDKLDKQPRVPAEEAISGFQEHLVCAWCARRRCEWLSSPQRHKPALRSTARCTG